MDIFEELQKEYDESPFDDLKITIDPERVANGKATKENIAKETLEILRELKELLNGDKEPEYKVEYKFTSE